MAVCIICAGAMVATRVPGRYCGEKVALASLLFAVGMIVTYSYIIYVPAVIAMATASWVPLMGRRRALSCAGWMVGATTLCFVGMATVLKRAVALAVVTVFNRKVAVHQGYRLVANGTLVLEGIAMCLSTAGHLRRNVGKASHYLACHLVRFFIVGTAAAGAASDGTSLDSTYHGDLASRNGCRL